MTTRFATPSDAGEIARLLAAYVAERFPGHPGTPAAQLREEMRRDHGQRLVVAEREGAMIGFVAWDRVYDLHWAASGALVADLYVEPGSRGHGVALALVAGVCAASSAEGGSFLRGGAYERSSPTGRFYERFAIGHDSAECHCGGRAFRHLADLHGSSLRAIARSLPSPAWNYEP